MAATYNKYPISNVDTIGNAIVSALTESGMYDTVSYDTTSKVITIANNSKTYCTLTVGGTFNVNVYTDSISSATSSSYGSVSNVAISVVGTNVFVTVFGSWRCSVIFTKSKNDKNMIVFSYVYNNFYYPVAVPNDASSIEKISIDTLGFPYISNPSIITTTAFIAQSVSETYAVSKSTYRLTRMPSVCGYPWTTGSMSDCLRVTVDGKAGITDGLFLVLDDTV